MIRIEVWEEKNNDPNGFVALIRIEHISCIIIDFDEVKLFINGHVFRVSREDYEELIAPFVK